MTYITIQVAAYHKKCVSVLQVLSACAQYDQIYLGFNFHGFSFLPTMFLFYLLLLLLFIMRSTETSELF